MEDDFIMSIIDGDEDENDDFLLDINAHKRKLTLEEVYRIEDTHWYYKYRKVALRKLLRQNIVGDNFKIIDVGIGTGSMSKYLDRFGSVVRLDNDYGVIQHCIDVHDYDVDYAELPWIIPEVELADYITILNTLEYIENDFWTLDSLVKKLKPDGKLIISTLSNKGLFGYNDSVYGILRRYDKSNLERMLIDIGYKIDYYTHFESSIFNSLKLMKNKAFEEEEIYLSKIPKNNLDIYKSIKLDLSSIGSKPIAMGNQLFIVASKMTDEEKDEQFEKDNRPSLLDKIFSKNNEED